jgi:hypothetical protein
LRECSLLSTYMLGISNLSELCQFQFAGQAAVMEMKKNG